MTREEASFYLANMDRKYMEEGMSEALDMAIKALEQEPCADAISRQEALNAITMAEVRWQAVDNVNKLPSVTPQQRTGRWKRISIDKYSEHAQYWYRCDKCGKDNFGNTDFCPKCGCKMEVEE